MLHGSCEEQMDNFRKTNLNVLHTGVGRRRGRHAVRLTDGHAQLVPRETRSLKTELKESAQCVGREMNVSRKAKTELVKSRKRS